MFCYLGIDIVWKLLLVNLVTSSLWPSPVLIPSRLSNTIPYMGSWPQSCLLKVNSLLFQTPQVSSFHLHFAPNGNFCITSLLLRRQGGAARIPSPTYPGLFSSLATLLFLTVWTGAPDQLLSDLFSTYFEFSIRNFINLWVEALSRYLQLPYPGLVSSEFHSLLPEPPIPPLSIPPTPQHSPSQLSIWKQ